MAKTTTEATEAKARQRARAGDVSAALAVPASRSGSSGIGQLVGRMEKRKWADIEDMAVHCVDVAGHIADFRMMASRQGTAQIIVPLAYLRDLLEASIDSTRHYAFIRVYVVPRPLMHSQEKVWEPGDDA